MMQTIECEAPKSFAAVVDPLSAGFTNEDTSRLTDAVENMRKEIDKQKITVENLRTAISIYEESLIVKDQLIEDLRKELDEKDVVIKTEYANNKLILEHVNMEQKLIIDVQKSTVYVRSFLVVIILVALCLIMFV